MEFEIKPFNGLSTNELYKLLKLRSEVFVVEQNCAYQDIDGKDGVALHVLGKKEDEIIAYLRIFRAVDPCGENAIGRVVVAESYRKNGYAKKIMEWAMTYIFEYMEEKTIMLSAQIYLIPFYKGLGFKEEGDIYLEDGIQHIKMVYA